MNKKNLERKVVTLGIVQVVGLLGLTIGCIAAAFCLGFFAGSSMEFETKLANMVASLPKLPVSESGISDEAGEQIVSEVYAKLNEQEQKAKQEASKKADEDNGNMPELSSIPQVEASPGDSHEIEEDVVDEESDLTQQMLTGSVKNGISEKTEDKKPSSGGDLNIKVLGDDVEEVKPKAVDTSHEATLGNLIDRDSKDKAAEDKLPKTEAVKPTPKPTLTPEVKIVKTPIETVKVQPTIAPKVELSKTNPAPASKLPGGWFAQVAAPKRIEDANELSRNLRSSGFPVMIEKAEVRGEEYFRVLVGPEGSKSQADILLKQLKRESYIKGDPFIRMVK